MWFHCVTNFIQLVSPQLVDQFCHIQVHPSGNYISVVILSPNYTSPSFMVATFLATYLIAVLQLSRYSVFHSRNTPIQLGLPWQSCSCQCLNTETSTQDNRGYTTDTPSISYSRNSYISLIINKDNFLLNLISGCHI